MPRIWRRLRRLRRSNVIATALLITALVLMVVVNFESEADVFEPPGAVSRSPETPVLIPAGEPIVLGFSGPLTGPLATFGGPEANAAISGVLRWKELNGDRIHGHRVDLVGEDDGGTEEDVAVVAANLLLARPRLVGIVGPVFSATAVATIDIYSAAGVIMISGSASRTDLTLTQSEPGFFFRTAFANAVEGPRQAEILIARLTTGTAFIIDDREAYGIDLAQRAVAPLRDAGWEIVRESVPQGTVDFSELVRRIVAADPDAVVFEGFNPEGALLLRQLRDGGYGGLFMAGDGVVSQSGFIGVLGDVAEGAILTGCPDTLSGDFVRLWQSGGGGAVPPISFLGSTADAAFLLIDAVARVAEPQPDGSLLIHPLKLRDAIAATQTVGWASGRQIAFDQHGDRVG
ncbi:MAG: branched-chain amino acid ABC transporter substrate-binding protein, partial [Dehalococcoidia bacterium]